MRVFVGDIVELDGGERKLVTESRDEIVPENGWPMHSRDNFRMRTVYRVAGKHDWYNSDDLMLVSKKR